MTWTPERVERLKVLVAEGLSGSQIARQLGGVTKNAVVSKCDRTGLQLGANRTGHRGHTRKTALAAKVVNYAKTAPVAVAKPNAPRDETPATLEVPTSAQLAKAIPFKERLQSQCAYIWDQNPNRDSVCCGEKIVGESSLSFCPHHKARATSKAPRKPIEQLAVRRAA